MVIKSPGFQATDGATYVTLTDGNGNTTGVGSAGNVGIDQTTPGTTNAVAMEAQYLTTAPTYTNGNINLVQMNNRGQLSTTAAAISAGADGVSNTNTAGPSGSLNGVATLGTGLLTANLYFNGTTWDRMRGDTNGSWSVGKGTSNLATNQVSVATTATQILAARAGRGAVTITNLGTTDIFIGGAAVTITTGTLLLGAKGSSITIPTNQAVYGIVGTGTQSVSYIETY